MRRPLAKAWWKTAIVVMCCLTLAACPFGVPSIEGVWFADLYVNGQLECDACVALTFDGDRGSSSTGTFLITDLVQGDVTVGTYEIASGPLPRAIDMTSDGGGGVPTTAMALYDFLPDGRLALALPPVVDDPRPDPEDLNPLTSVFLFVGT
jgi:hypothetical protein